MSPRFQSIMLRSSRRCRRGASMLEVTIAFGILIVAMGLIATGTVRVQRLLSESEVRQRERLAIESLRESIGTWSYDRIQKETIEQQPITLVESSRNARYRWKCIVQDMTDPLDGKQITLSLDRIANESRSNPILEQGPAPVTFWVTKP